MCRTPDSCPPPYLDPLLTVDLHAVGPQRGDGALNDLLHHLRVAVGLLQLGGCGPDVPVGGDVLTGLIQDLAGILIGLQPCQSEPELMERTAGKEWGINAVRPMALPQNSESSAGPSKQPLNMTAALVT